MIRKEIECGEQGERRRSLAFQHVLGANGCDLILGEEAGKKQSTGTIQLPFLILQLKRTIDFHFFELSKTLFSVRDGKFVRIKACGSGAKYEAPTGVFNTFNRSINGFPQVRILCYMIISLCVKHPVSFVVL